MGTVRAWVDIATYALCFVRFFSVPCELSHCRETEDKWKAVEQKLHEQSQILEETSSAHRLRQHQLHDAANELHNATLLVQELQSEVLFSIVMFFSWTWMLKTVLYRLRRPEYRATKPNGSLPNPPLA